MKIAYISGVKFGHELLSHILKNNWHVEVVLSYADSKKKLYSDFSSFDDLTTKFKIRHIKVDNINDITNFKILKQIKPDLLLVMGWSQIIKDILNIPGIKIIGSHPTELPKYRGRAPIPWTIIKKLKTSALTFFWMSESVDDGAILDQRTFEITEKDDATSVYDKIIQIGKKMLLDNLPLLEKGVAPKRPQDESQFIEYWQKRTPDDGKIDWGHSSKDIHTLIRATSHPYPGAFTFFKKSKLTIWKADYKDKGVFTPGKIVNIQKDGVEIGTGKGILILRMVSIDDQNEKNPARVFSKDDLGKMLL